MAFDLKTFLPYRLSVLSNRISQRLASVYQQASDLDIPQWRVLAILASQDRMTATQVAKAASMDKVRISRTVSRLKEKGLVRQEGCPEDGRARRYQLTEKGLALYQQLLPRVRACEAELFSALNEQEKATLQHLLDKIDQQF